MQCLLAYLLRLCKFWILSKSLLEGAELRKGREKGRERKRGRKIGSSLVPTDVISTLSGSLEESRFIFITSL